MAGEGAVLSFPPAAQAPGGRNTGGPPGISQERTNGTPFLPESCTFGELASPENFWLRNQGPGGCIAHSLPRTNPFSLFRCCLALQARDLEDLGLGHAEKQGPERDSLARSPDGQSPLAQAGLVSRRM